jgi:apolipoprotein N-acyltransferase
MRMWSWALSLLAGALHGVAMAWPDFGLDLNHTIFLAAGQASGVLQCLSLALLGGVLLQLASQEIPEPAAPQNANQKSKPKPIWRQAAWASGLFATSAMVATWGWLYVSMHRYGGLPSWLSALAVCLLALALSLYFAVAGGIWVTIFRGWVLSARAVEGRYVAGQKGWGLAEFKQGLGGAMLLAALWTLAELCRGQWFTGFPWGAGGYAHTDSALAAYAPWLGVYGMGAVAVFVSMCVPILLAQFLARRTAAWQALLAVVLVCGAGVPWLLSQFNPALSQAAGRMQVKLLQGNIPQDEKFVPGQGVKMSLSWYRAQMLDNDAPLLVTPETAIPVLPQQLPAAYWQALKDKYEPAKNPENSASSANTESLDTSASPVPQPARSPQLALIGLPLGGPDVGYSNSVMAMGSTRAQGAEPSQAIAYRYDKQHLVPFGEFVPPFFQWFVRMMNMPMGDFEQNREASSVLSWRDQRLLPQICYEDLFGEEMAQRYFANEATAPTVLVNMSNLAWFGDTTAAPQHAAISRMRALEFQRPVIRATNTGLTALIDAQGQITAALPVFTRGSLLGEFEGRTGLTPYARWTSQWGLMPIWLICGLIVLVLGLYTGRPALRSL